MFIDDRVKQTIPDINNYIVGYADMQGLLAPAYHPFRYAIVLARKLDHTIINSITSGPTRDYLQHYHHVNQEIAETVSRIAQKLAQEAIRSLPIQPTNSDQKFTDEYLKTLRHDFSHKMAATRAGLGWIGKTDLLITYQHGPRVRLGTILVDYPFEKTGHPVIKSECGDCQVCVTVCPAQAANGKSWEVGIDRNEFYDPFKCMNTCRALSRQNLNEVISLCGICVNACPKGKLRSE